MTYSILLSPVSQHRIYSELTTNNPSRAAKRNMNSVENDRLVTYITAIIGP